MEVTIIKPGVIAPKGRYQEGRVTMPGIVRTFACSEDKSDSEKSTKRFTSGVGK